MAFLNIRYFEMAYKHSQDVTEMLSESGNRLWFL